MTNENEKENIGAISNEENQQNVEVFTMANVQNYILTHERKTQPEKHRLRLDVSVASGGIQGKVKRPTKAGE